MGYRLPLTEPRLEVIRKVVGPAIDRALRSRTSLEDEWAENDELYNSKVMPTDFPWPGASAFAVPLGETYVNAIGGRLTDSIHAPEPVITVRSRTSRWVEAAKAMQDLANWVMTDVVKLRRAVSEPFNFCLAKHGTAFVIAPWQIILDKRMEYNVDTDAVEINLKAREIGPAAFVPPIHDVLLPKQALTPNRSPWIAYRVRLSDDDMDTRELSQVYDGPAIGRVRKYMDEHPDDLTRRQQSDVGYSTTDYDPFYEVWEWWGLLKLPGHKYATEVVVPYHVNSGEPLALLVNFYPRQFRPFFSSQFQTLGTGVYGRGVLRMVRSGNIEINKLHKCRVDNAMVANTRGYKVRKSTYLQLPRQFKIWPGKMVPVDSMEDFEPFAMADVYGSTLEAELQTEMKMQQLVGLSDFSLSSGGGEGLKRVGATAALTAVQESGRALNNRLNHVRDMYGELSLWYLDMYSHFQPLDQVAMVVGPKGMQALMEWWAQPIEVRQANMAVELTASSATINREIEKQSDVLLVNIWSNYATKVAELSQVVMNPQAPPELRALYKQIINGGNVLMKDVLRDFNKRSDSLILTEAFNGGEGVEGPVAEQPGMAGVLPMAGGQGVQPASNPADNGWIGGSGETGGTLPGDFGGL